MRLAMLSGLSVMAMALPLGNAKATKWTTHNRSIGLRAVALHQDYRETDTQGLAADGTLNTERGARGGLPGARAAQIL